MSIELNLRHTGREDGKKIFIITIKWCAAFVTTVAIRMNNRWIYLIDHLQGLAAIKRNITRPRYGIVKTNRRRTLMLQNYTTSVDYTHCSSIGTLGDIVRRGWRCSRALREYLRKLHVLIRRLFDVLFFVHNLYAAWEKFRKSDYRAVWRWTGCTRMAWFLGETTSEARRYTARAEA